MDTFAPVVKATLIRLLLTIASQLQLYVHQFDVETAFLNPEIDQEIYVEQPPFFEVPGYPRNDWVCLLNKALYGLKQSPLLWANDLKDTLLSFNFKQLNSDESIFINKEEFIIIAAYVDDILILSKSTDTIENVRCKLNSVFKIRNLEQVKKFLGLEIHRDYPIGPIRVN